MACIIPIGLMRLVPSSILLALSSMCFYPNFFNLGLSLECKRHAQHKHDPCCSMEQSLALKVCFLCLHVYVYFMCHVVPLSSWISNVSRAELFR